MLTKWECELGKEDCTRQMPQCNNLEMSSAETTSSHQRQLSEGHSVDISSHFVTDEAVDYWQITMAQQLCQYLCWPILILGLCGNILSFLVFNKKGSMRRQVLPIIILMY